MYFKSHIIPFTIAWDSAARVARKQTRSHKWGDKLFNKSFNFFILFILLILHSYILFLSITSRHRCAWLAEFRNCRLSWKFNFDVDRQASTILRAKAYSILADARDSLYSPTSPFLIIDDFISFWSVRHNVCIILKLILLYRYKIKIYRELYSFLFLLLFRWKLFNLTLIYPVRLYKAINHEHTIFEIINYPLLIYFHPCEDVFMKYQLSKDSLLGLCWCAIILDNSQ